MLRARGTSKAQRIKTEIPQQVVDLYPKSTKKNTLLSRLSALCLSCLRTPSRLIPVFFFFSIAVYESGKNFKLDESKTKISSDLRWSKNVNGEPIRAENSDRVTSRTISSGGNALNHSGNLEIVSTSLEEVETLIGEIKEEFFVRYGGKKAALTLLSDGLVSFDKTSEAQGTATRILRALATSKRFVFSFGGYSITVGRGNLYTQSYPFVLEKVLSPLTKIMGLDLVVRNAAIGGTPSFPAGWCLPNFLGRDADVISWDYSMNEGSQTFGLEAYIRHGIVLDKDPIFIMMDRKGSRMKLLETYAVMRDNFHSLAVNMDASNKSFLNMREEDRPTGYRHWDDWGAPKGSPGQSSWHKKYMQHELIGWIIAMHFVEGFSHAVDIMKNESDWEVKYSTPRGLSFLPKPVSSVSSKKMSSIMYGNAITDDKDGAWKMNHVSCRTSFKPTVHGGLLDIVESGISPSKNDPEKVMEFDGTDADYGNGWIVDVGTLEKNTKRKVNKYGGLGFIDMKVALYGVTKSGTLRLFLPHETDNKEVLNVVRGSIKAKDYFHSLILCEVNEKRGNSECNMVKDLTIVVGNVESNNIQTIEEASYLNKKICIIVDIPDDATVTKKGGHYGLAVDVTVNNDKLVHQTACSISHVVWENVSQNLAGTL